MGAIRNGVQTANRWWRYHHRRIQHIYQNIFRITADGNDRITAGGDTRITADSDY